MCLFQTMKEFRDDELHHHDIGLENDAEKVISTQNSLYNTIAGIQSKNRVSLNHLCRVDSSTSFLWTNPFPV